MLISKLWRYLTHSEGEGVMETKHQADLDNLVALEFNDERDFSDAVGIFVRELPRHQFFVPGRNTLIIDAEEDKEKFKSYLEKANLQFKERDVVSGSKISAERLSELRRINILRRQ